MPKQGSKYYIKSPYKADREAKKQRVICVLKTEGHILTDEVIRERFGISATALKTLRKELGIPCPGSEYLSLKDLRDISDIPPGQPFHARGRGKNWKKNVDKAKERSRKYKEDESSQGAREK